MGVQALRHRRCDHCGLLRGATTIWYLSITARHGCGVVREVMLHWLRRGIDGWRLDAAYAVPANFWAAVLLLRSKRSSPTPGLSVR